MTTAVEVAERPVAEGEPPELAVRPVVAVAVVSAVVLLLSATRYGYFGDELYFLSAGERLSFGYADQGPVLPLLARLMDTIAAGSLVVLRLPAIALTVLAVVLSACIAREFGGGRGAQVLTALAYATSPFLLLQGKNLSTNAIDVALWVVITWLVVRWVRTRRDRLLLCAALVTAIDMQVKWLIPFFWIAVAVTALVFGPRDLVRRPLLWLGGFIVLVATTPTLLWQARHGWPQLALGTVISAESDVVGGRFLFVPLAVVLAGALGAVLLCYGVWALLRARSLRPYRFLGATTLLLVVVFMILGGRMYYLAGMYAVAIAAGAVGLVDVVRRARSAGRRRAATGAGFVLAAGSVALVLWSTPWPDPAQVPVPASETEAAIQIGIYGEFGWPELADGVTAAYAALDPGDKARAVVVTDSYWQASALDQLAGDRLPSVYSPSRGFGYFGAPPDTASTILYVGGDEEWLRTQFAVVEPAGRVDSRLGFLGVTRDVSVWKCVDPHTPWSRLWPEWMHL
ncbi:glycosyltransferase family 39 protein [Nocardia donostiensis]|uniref:Glycosyl transferase family 39 n=1 Tax=Nocardia donostiensis TaxID=1538463 RepID=A0A1V2TL06_9NOCA|nr:glycosyltransferase family 39 protein [Nocardia donostiensis]ONM50179.1 glycosyl transferase family 39 [Nocardia donostiensis]OQS15840.1 glycosyl transferase family 39 [Nocardia donostiensis]OQS23646.1 glycosyl transferase family 39 [Nocardia donostiensis]